MRISSPAASTPLRAVKSSPVAGAPRLSLVRPDAFVGRASATATRESPYAEQISATFRQQLGREPTAEEVQRYTQLAESVAAQGKGPADIEAAFRWVVCSGPEWQATQVFREELGRDPTPDELQKSITWGNELGAQGRSTGELRAAFQFVTRMGPEWQARSVSQKELGRDPTPDELQRSIEWGSSLLAEGKSTGEMRGAFEFVTRLSPEYQALHPEGAIRSQIADWAIAQANDPNVGYSKVAGRFGERTDGNGHRFYDCSGLVTAAYAQAGIQLPANWTGAMRETWPQWADQVPKDTAQMQPGDLLLMDGHVVMYTGDGMCVGAQGSKLAWDDQVRTGIDAQTYLNRGDCIVIRPRI